jgi:hypothetical protein
VKDRFKPFVERVAGQIERVRAHQATGAGEAENQWQLAGACTDLCSRLFEEGCDLSRFISPARLVAIADLTSQVLPRMIFSMCACVCGGARVRWRVRVR